MNGFGRSEMKPSGDAAARVTTRPSRSESNLVQKCTSSGWKLLLTANLVQKCTRFRRNLLLIANLVQKCTRFRPFGAGLAKSGAKMHQI